jgi:hypothetical protein
MTEPTVETTEETIPTAPVVEEPVLDDEDDLAEPSELDSLRARADLMGLQYKRTLGVEKMRELVNAAVNAEANKLPDLQAAAEQAVTTNFAQVLSEVTQDQLAAAIAAVPEVPKAETLSEKRYRLKQEANKLVRVHIMNMNPARKDWESDTYTVGNAYIGTITRTIPFNVDWHVEQALLNVLQERECIVFREKKDQQTGHMSVKSVRIKELQIAILPPLTEQELKELGRRQAMAAGTETDED